MFINQRLRMHSTLRFNVSKCSFSLFLYFIFILSIHYLHFYIYSVKLIIKSISRWKRLYEFIHGTHRCAFITFPPLCAACERKTYARQLFLSFSLGLCSLIRTRSLLYTSMIICYKYQRHRNWHSACKCIKLLFKSWSIACTLECRSIVISHYLNKNQHYFKLRNS